MEKDNSLIRALKELSVLYNSKDKKIVIFGAGDRGKIISNKIKDLGINIDYFCDNNIENNNKFIQGIKCISFEELKKIKEDTMVIVSPYKNEEIINQLQENGFQNVLNKKHEIFLYFSFLLDFNYEDLINFFGYGHYYSLYPNLDEIKSNEDAIFSNKKIVKDIKLNDKKQLEVLNKMVDMYSSIPNWESKDRKYRYILKNLSFDFADAVGLHCMLRMLKPKNMIEVGSGYTSALTLDTNEFYLDNSINLEFIEPYADRLKALLKPTDNVKILEKGLQYIDLSHFDKLEEGDILFIDSTHVSKINSDVNYLFFEILPRLKKGVYIHLHDIFYPFEYPKEWIYTGMIWNELYLLRAFLQNNDNYEIVFFQNMLEKEYKEEYEKKWKFNKSIHGASFWMRKLK